MSEEPKTAGTAKEKAAEKSWHHLAWRPAGSRSLAEHWIRAGEPAAPAAAAPGPDRTP